MKTNTAKLAATFLVSVLVTASIQPAFANETRCGLFNLAVCTDKGEGGESFGGGERGDGGRERGGNEDGPKAE